MARGSSNRNGKPEARGGGAMKLVFLGLLLGLVVAAVMAWYLLPRAGDFKPVAKAPTPRPPAVAVPSPPPPPVTEAPTARPPDPSNYTFYDILPGQAVPKPHAPKAAKEHWWLQVAALKDPAAADALRARLTLLNLSAVVQPAPGTPPMHRVRVGPFADPAAAEAVKNTLLENKLEARLLKAPVTP